MEVEINMRDAVESRAGFSLLAAGMYVLYMRVFLYGSVGDRDI